MHISLEIYEGIINSARILQVLNDCFHQLPMRSKEQKSDTLALSNTTIRFFWREHLETIGPLKRNTFNYNYAHVDFILQIKWLWDIFPKIFAIMIFY